MTKIVDRAVRKSATAREKRRKNTRKTRPGMDAVHATLSCNRLQDK